MKNYLGFAEVLQLVSAAGTVIVGVFTALLKLKKHNGEWNNRAYWLISLLVFFALVSVAISINQAYKNYTEKIEAQQKATRDSIQNQKENLSIIKSSEATLKTSNEALDGVEASIESLNN
jgi:hypothetical protein